MSPIGQREPFRPATGRASLARTALAVSVLVAAARAAALSGAAAVAAQPDLVPARFATSLAGIADSLSLATLVMAALAWLPWVAWTSRLEQNTGALGAGEGSVGPRGAILWWLVPGFNLLVPFGQLLGVDRRLADGEQRSHDALIVTWWVVLLAAAAVVIATTVPLAADGAAGATSANLANAALASLAWLVASVISFRVVRVVQRDEDRRSAVVSQGWRPGAPSWPVGPAGATPAAIKSAVPATFRMPPPAVPSAVPSAVASSAVSGWPSAARPASAPGAAARPVAAATQPSGWITAPGPAPARRRSVARAPGWILPILLISGVAGLAYEALRSPGSSGAIPPPAFPSATIQVTARPRPTVTPRPTAVRPTPTGKPATPTPRGTPRQTVPGTAVLTAHLTNGDGACDQIDPAAWPPGSLAAVACRPANSAVATLRYALYRSPDEAETAYEADLGASGVEAGTGNCFEATPGESSFSTNNSARGRVFCLLDGADAVPTMTWFDRTLSIVGWATGTGSDLGPLTEWWINESGPA